MQAGYTLDDVGQTLSWGALRSFLTYSRPDSAVVKKLSPDLSEWGSTVKTNMILADIFDQLGITNALLKSLITRKPAKKPKPYKRPGQKDKNTRHYGSKPLKSVDEMREWIKQRQVKRDGD